MRKRSRLYAAVLERFPGQPKVWMSYGHVLKTVGRQGESVAAYRRAIAAAPTLGEAWWSLANLKTVELGEADVAAMESALAAAGLAEEDRFHLHFALGKALEDAGEAGARLRPLRRGQPAAPGRARLRPRRDRAPRRAQRRALHPPLSSPGAKARAAPTRDPIFILGMPRAGSTLIEQILASHSEVEGTMELPDIPALAKRLGGRKLKSEPTAYPESLAGLSAAELEALGDGISRAHPNPAQDRPALVHRQAAQQLGPCRADPPDPAECEDRRRPPPPARLLLLQLQAAFRPRPGLQLRPRRARPLLPRLCRADGAISTRFCRAGSTA